MHISNWVQSGTYHIHKGKHQIFYKDSNNGKVVLLLLHGFPTSSWDWSKVWPDLEKEFRLIAIDFIGYGLSDKPYKYKYSTFDQATIVKDILRKLDISKYHILAHDYGDTVAQEIMFQYLNNLSYGRKILSVCLLNGGILQDGYKPRWIQKLLAGKVGVLFTPFLNKTLLKRNFNRIFGPKTKASRQEIHTFFELITKNGGRFVLPKTIQYLKERQENANRWKAALRKFDGPLLMINGNYDPISGINLSRMASKEIPNMEIINLEQIGHYPQTEAPKIIVQEYLKFRKQINS